MDKEKLLGLLDDLKECVGGKEPKRLHTHKAFMHFIQMFSPTRGVKLEWQLIKNAGCWDKIQYFCISKKDDEFKIAYYFNRADLSYEEYKQLTSIPVAGSFLTVDQEKQEKLFKDSYDDDKNYSVDSFFGVDSEESYLAKSLNEGNYTIMTHERFCSVETKTEKVFKDD